MGIKKLIQLLITPLPSFLRIFFLRLSGAKIGKHARIAPFTILLSDEIELGPCTHIKPLSIIKLSHLKMDAYSCISYLCIIHGPKSLILKPRSFIAACCLIDLHACVTIGEYSATGSRSTIMTHATHLPTSWGFSNKTAPVTIGDFVSISHSCKIGAGVSIASNNVLVPNSTILQNINTSGLLFDSSLERKTFPFSFVKKDITSEWLTEFIEERIRDYSNDILKPRGFTFSRKDNFFLLVKGRRKIAIHLNASADNSMPGYSNWVWGFNLPDSLLEGKSKVQALDFLRILHSSNRGKKLKEAIDYLRHTSGLRFADFKYNNLFKVVPPVLGENSDRSE